MMKFFRKHNKKLLAIFMVLLMIVFLGGSALDNLLQPSVNRVVANSDLGTISYADQQLATHITSVLGAVGFNWKRPLSGAGTPLELIDWILLNREAAHLGLGGSTRSVEAAMGARGSVDTLARTLRVKPATLVRAMADYDAIQKTALAVGQAATPSVAEIEATARRVLEKVKINAILLPAQEFEDADQEFSDEQIQEQFDRYRDREAGTGLEFGYYVPHELKLQYITIDAAKLAEYLRTGRAEALDRQAYEYYLARRETDPKFRRPAEDISNEASDEELEGPPAEKSPYLPWEDVKELALSLVLIDQVEQTSSRIADWLIQELSAKWLEGESQKDGYRTAPEGVDELEYYDRVVAMVPRTLAPPGLLTTHTTDFFTKKEAFDVPDLGNATFRSDRAVTGLSELAFRTKAIIPKVPTDGDASPSDYLSPFQTCRYPLSTLEGNEYLFRVIDDRPPHVPTTVAEVRDKVVRDLRLQDAYEQALARAESLRSCTGAISLEEAFESDAELVAMRGTREGFSVGFFSPPPFARTDSYTAAEGKDEAQRWVGGGLGMVPVDVIEECFQLEFAANKIDVIKMPDRAVVMVVEWIETQHADGGEYEKMRDRFTRQLYSSRSKEAITAWLDPEQIRARHAFAPVTN